MKEGISKETGIIAFQGMAKLQGMVTLREDGILKVLEGITTFDEVQKVVGDLMF